MIKDICKYLKSGERLFIELYSRDDREPDQFKDIAVTLETIITGKRYVTRRLVSRREIEDSKYCIDGMVLAQLRESVNNARAMAGERETMLCQHCGLVYKDNHSPV